MKFEQLLNNFDMGICVEQLQKESLLDLALLFVTVDGSIADEELNVVEAWAHKIEWNSAIELDNYMVDMTRKCVLAVQSGEIDSFIQHRMTHIIDQPMRVFVLELLKQVIEADGITDENELKALKIVESIV
ncbi:MULTISPECIES: hypothetical protein [Pseudoalteromonas]|jgi:hypothetical protein|uniref:Co-chaperone DjlA N-terminal domain-containing protein n=1 Tax=Pseudoalteromonas aliena SW19 TaxID=1314866 RepID=A0ABR9E3I1_9GAMM|nr:MULTISPECIES: hypothetical protein [Pseudoalteromonas]MBE0361157.1 hypothetical protein [Pseudoalteromonas aliena SW19]